MSSFRLFFLLLLLVSSTAQTYTNISLGTTFSPLTPPTSHPSPSGDFAFGFRPLDADPTLYLLAVWYLNIPPQTVVWSANGAKPVTNSSTATLTPDGQLILTDHGATIWNAGVNTTTYASMLDTGNFALASSTGVAWQTFDNPTDTILPGQTLGQGTNMYAKLTDDDYSPGRFELALQPDGNLVLYAVAYPTKFRYDTYWATNVFGTGMRLVFNQTAGSIDVVLANNSKVPVLPPPDLGGSDYYFRATLDPDGVFRQYVFQKSSKPSAGSWTVKNSLKSDICNFNFVTGSGSCGFNSYCIPDANGKSNCQCPPHYSFFDPANKFSGCKPDFAAQSCEPGGEVTFSFATVDRVDWPLSDAEQFSPMNETECTDNCLKDCFCSVAIYDADVNNGTCWKKKNPLSNGRMNSGVTRTALIKYSMVNGTFRR